MIRFLLPFNGMKGWPISYVHVPYVLFNLFHVIDISPQSCTPFSEI